MVLFLESFTKLLQKMKVLNHKIGTREEWLAARLELLKAEKELTQRSDELAEWRQKLPWVRIDKEYHFETDARSSLSITSCSAPSTLVAAQRARRSRMASMALQCTSSTTTSR